MDKILRLTILFLLLCLLICGCQSQEDNLTTSLELQEETEIYLLWGVLKEKIPNESLNYSQLIGSAFATCTYGEILEIIQSEQLIYTECSFPSTGVYMYELASVVSKDAYHEMLQKNKAPSELLCLISFAYSYETHAVYLLTPEHTYFVENPQFLRERIGTILTNAGIGADIKQNWLKNDAFIKKTISNQENSYYYSNFSFRYERYWCIEQELPDKYFSELPGYSANQINSLEEMLCALSESLGYMDFEAYVSEDILTGYWEIEIYNLTGNAHAKIYLDNTYQILYGWDLSVYPS